MKNLFYCAFESIFDPIFDSQVVVFLEKINARMKDEGLDKNNREIYLVLFHSIGDFFNRSYLLKRREIANRLGGRCFFCMKFTYMHNFPYLFEACLYLNTLIAAMAFLWIPILERFKGGSKNTEGNTGSLAKGTKIVIHCRTEIGSYIIFNLKKILKRRKISIICDCRGIGSKEILYKLSGKKRLISSGKIEKVEKFIHSNADYIFCVSNAFRRYILENARAGMDRIKVVHCCVDRERFNFTPQVRKEARREMKLEEKFVILYAGSMNEWQLPDEMVKIFKAFKEKISSAFLLVLTKDYNYTRNLLENAGLDANDYLILSKPHQQMGKYLQAGDLGLLIREENEVNSVAFPVKFGEYVRSGVPVLSSITSDVGDLIKEKGLGFFISDYQDIREVLGIAGEVKENLSYFTGDEFKFKVKDNLGGKIIWETYLDSIIQVYQELLSG